jgi:hypothetical protein
MDERRGWRGKLMQWLRRAIGAEIPAEHLRLMDEVSSHIDAQEARLRELRTLQESRGLAVEVEAIAREHGVEPPWGAR